MRIHPPLSLHLHLHPYLHLYLHLYLHVRGSLHLYLHLYLHLICIFVLIAQRYRLLTCVGSSISSSRPRLQSSTSFVWRTPCRSHWCIADVQFRSRRLLHVQECRRHEAGIVLPVMVPMPVYHGKPPQRKSIVLPHGHGATWRRRWQACGATPWLPCFSSRLEGERRSDDRRELYCCEGWIGFRYCCSRIGVDIAILSAVFCVLCIF